MKNNITLEQMANDLELDLETYEQIKDNITCPRCHKLQVDRDNLIALRYLGICLNCDHVEYE